MPKSVYFKRYVPSAPIAPPPIPAKPKIEDKTTWRSVAKIAVIAAAVATVAGLAFYAYTSSLTNQGAVDLDWSEDKELKDILRDVCRESVNNYYKLDGEGNKVWLKDFVSSGWKPEILFEHKKHILCPVEVQSQDCEALTGKLTQDQWENNEQGSFIFNTNFESIPAKLPGFISSKFKEFIFQNVRLDSLTNVFHFKSHIHCIKI